MSSDNTPDTPSQRSDWNRRRVSYLRMGRSFIDGINPDRSLNPLKNLFRKRREIVETSINWFYSRNWVLAYSAAPVLLVSLLAFLTAVWARSHADFSAHRQFLLRSLQTANSAADVVRQELSLRALQNLEPLNSNYALQLAELLRGSGRVADAINTLRPYAPSDAAGSPEIRLWLLDLAAQNPQDLSLSEEERIAQLQRVLSESPGNVKASKTLAGIWTARQEWQLAERCLEESAALFPEVNLELLKLQILLGRSPEDRSKTGQLAVSGITKRLEEQPNDVLLTCSLAEALYLSQKPLEAREKLEEWLKRSDDDAVKKVLSRLEFLIAQSELMESVENKDSCTVMLYRSLKLDPSNQEAIQLLRTVDRAGALIVKGELQACIDFWRERLRLEPENRNALRTLASLQELIGEPRAAADLIRTDIGRYPGDRLYLVDLLTKAQHTDQADQMAQLAVSEQQQALEKNPADREARVNIARCLLILKRPEDARKMLLDASDEILNECRRDPKWMAVFGAASLAMFDDQTELTGKLSTISQTAMPVIRDRAHGRELLPLLKDVVMSGPITDSTSVPLAGIDRIVRIALTGGAAARDADKLLTELRSDGIFVLDILSLQAAHALTLENYDLAVQSLELANSMTNGANPLILNNLAIAKVRSKPSRPWEALKHIEVSIRELPDNPEILSTRGEIHIALNSLNEAEKDLRHSLRIRSDRPKVHRMLADVLKRTGQDKEAVAHLNEAEKLERLQGAEQARRP